MLSLLPVVREGSKENNIIIIIIMKTKEEIIQDIQARPHSVLSTHPVISKNSNGYFIDQEGRVYNRVKFIKEPFFEGVCVVDAANGESLICPLTNLNKQQLFEVLDDHLKAEVQELIDDYDTCDKDCWSADAVEVLCAIKAWNYSCWPRRGRLTAFTED